MSVGTNSETICSASAAAVLFTLTKEVSGVLRIWISRAVGGFGLKPAMRKIIHANPPQVHSAANACNGIASSLSLMR
jgi:hypothetical protein